jgi:sulfate adenylyltransferase
MGAFKEPHGGELKNLYLPVDEAEAEKLVARHYASWDLTERRLCDIELLLNGAFSPLDETTDQDHVPELSGVELRRRLQEGLDTPEWFSFLDIIGELRRTQPPLRKQGFTVLFTGLRGRVRRRLRTRSW